MAPSPLVNEPANKRENVDLVGDIKGRGRLIKGGDNRGFAQRASRARRAAAPHLKACR